MKTIHIPAIDPNDGFVRDNEIFVSRIVGWYTRHRHYIQLPSPGSIDAYWKGFEGSTTIISLDSGAEYEIAESQESFRDRLAAIIDPPSFGFTGFTPILPSFRVPQPEVVRYFNCHPLCAECNNPMSQTGRQDGRMLISCRSRLCKQFGLVAKIPSLTDPVFRVDKD